MQAPTRPGGVERRPLRGTGDFPGIAMTLVAESAQSRRGRPDWGGELFRESLLHRAAALEGARLYLNPSVQGPRSHDAIGSVHRAWGERRM